MDDASLGKFIAAVEKVRREGAGRVDAATREEIARELGWSEEDLAAVKQRGEESLARGEGFLRHRAWEDAVSHLVDAEVLLPDDLRVLEALARAYEGLGDVEGMRHATDRCLALDPRHEPSFALRARLARRPSRAAEIGTRLLAVILLIAISIGVVIGVRWVRAPRAAARGLCNGESYCERPIAVATIPNLLVERPILRVSPRELRLELGGKVVHPEGETSELEQLVVEVRLFDEEGARLEARELIAQQEFAPPLRPGDTAPFYYGEAVPAETRRVELASLRRRAIPAPTTYEAAKAVELGFEPAAPSHLQLRAGMRSYQRQKLDEMTSFEAVLEVENVGQGVIRALELEWRAKDAAGALLGRADKQTVVYAHMPAMSPGERRLVRMRLWVPSRVASEAVVVTKVQ